MFIVSLPCMKSKLGKTVFFLNDTKDVIDVCLQTNPRECEIEKANEWLSNATFGLRHANDKFVIMCVTDDYAYTMAKFYGCGNEYIKTYGRPA